MYVSEAVRQLSAFILSFHVGFASNIQTDLNFDKFQFSRLFLSLSASNLRMSTSQNPGPPPPRWKKCPRKSEQLVGGKFLAMKTPLDKR